MNTHNQPTDRAGVAEVNTVIVKHLGVGVYVAIFMALALGLAAGVQWHASIASSIGLHAHDHTAEKAGNDAMGHKHLWTCSMHPQVLKEEPGACPICHMALTPVKEMARPGSATAATGERKVKYWWDPMLSPPYIADKPGKSPMGMDLIAVYEDQVSGGTGVTIDPVIVQNMGVRVAVVTTGPVTRDVRAVGYLEQAQPNARDVNLRISGWVEKLNADTVGMALSKGAPLFELYSPEVQIATEELIAARKSVGAIGPDGDAMARKTSQGLFDATRLKLEQWGLDSAEVARLATLDHPPRTVTFTSPIDGYLTQKILVQGGAVKSGDTVLRIVDLSTVWLDSQVYAQDLPFVRLGRSVTATVDGIPGRKLEGKVIFIQPELNPQTRTAIVRIALPNTDLALRPGMYASASIHATLTDRAILVPREAVIDTGTRQIAFVSAGGGRFEPRQVRLGADSEGGIVQVLEGLAPGESVVTSGQFLLDAESRLREAIQKHLDTQLLVKGPVEKMPSGDMTSMLPATQFATPHAIHDPTTRPPHSAIWTPEVDRVFEAYLSVQKVLGAPQQKDTSLDVASLETAARALTHGRGEDTIDPQAVRVMEAATKLQGKTLTEQRKLFEPLSDAIIALAKANPPSTAIAPGLYIAYCPMSPGSDGRWLQTTDVIANPFFATKMKDCGSIERMLNTVVPKK